MTAVREEVETVLARLNALVGSKDAGVAAVFDETALLIGSEPGEIARGRPAIAAFFERIYAMPVTIGWDWSSLDAAAEADIVWFYAEGHAVLDRGDRLDRLPYRLSGVLARRDGTLLWQQFHGSEPKA